MCADEVMGFRVLILNLIFFEFGSLGWKIREGVNGFV
jgi:hypothetical protein